MTSNASLNVFQSKHSKYLLEVSGVCEYYGSISSSSSWGVASLRGRGSASVPRSPLRRTYGQAGPLGMSANPSGDKKVRRPFSLIIMYNFLHWKTKRDILKNDHATRFPFLPFMTTSGRPYGSYSVSSYAADMRLRFCRMRSAR